MATGAVADEGEERKRESERNVEDGGADSWVRGPGRGRFEEINAHLAERRHGVRKGTRCARRRGNG